jgi:hypothetical protein
MFSFHQPWAGSSRAGKLRGLPAAGFSSAQELEGVPDGSIGAGGGRLDPRSASAPQPAASAADRTKTNANGETCLRIMDVACRSVPGRIALAAGRRDRQAAHDVDSL